MALGSTFNLQSDAFSWVENIDTEKFLIGLGKNYQPMSYPTMFYCSVGKQQWGLTGNDPGNGGASAQLSIPITTLIFGQARTTSSEIISSVFSIDVADGLTLYIDSSNIQYQGGYAYLIGSR